MASTTSADPLVPATRRLLIADDDPAVRLALRLLLSQHGYEVVTAEDPSGALEHAGAVDLVIQDMNFSRQTSGREGLELLARLRARRPELPVVLLTAWGSIGLAVEGMKLGAADFLTKPWSNPELVRTVANALATHPLRHPGSGPPPARRELDHRGKLAALVGEHPRLLAVLDLLTRVAPTDATVLITGESGTGKELVAKALHDTSRRSRGPFVKVNLGGLATSVFESELFGHVRGAFTDARADRQGRFAAADGGTIFLDEIGELEPASQVKLLRVLQDKTFEPLGSSVSRTVDVRVVSATNRDLAAAVAQGQFREDLLYRLNLVTLHLPALRERSSDIVLLAQRFVGDAARTFGRPPPELSADALAWLTAQSWPGNVRQLEQSLARAVLLVPGARIERADLVALADPGGKVPTGANNDRTSTSQEGQHPGTIEDLERSAIERALAQSGGNLSRAAQALGLTRQALYRRLDRHRLRQGGDESG